MALELPYAAAFTCQRTTHRVCGVELSPLCLWHLFLLAECDSPFLREGDVGWDDLRQAVGICRLQFPDATIVLPKKPGWIERRRFRIQVVRFLTYAAAHLHRPKYKIDPVPGAAPKVRGAAPEQLAHFADLFAWGRWSEAQVWNLPMPRAEWYRPLALRAAGHSVSFQTAHDRKFEDDMRAHEAGVAAEKAAQSEVHQSRTEASSPLPSEGRAVASNSKSSGA